MYQNIQQLVEEAEKRGVALSKIVLEEEMRFSEITEKEVYQRLEQRWRIMKTSLNAEEIQPSDEGLYLILGQSQKQREYKGALAGDTINQVMSLAFNASEVNATMGRICAAPTAGACGILPAVIEVVSKKCQSTEKEILNALLTASGVGAVITQNATVSGAKGGCQAECGVAAAMAAAAAVEMAGGTGKMCANAVAIALMNCMGLVCDPVAGLVQLPCSFRNASQSANALISADMALAGQESLIPADEVIEAMYQVGKKLPEELRETGMGGIANTITGKKIKKELFAV